MGRLQTTTVQKEGTGYHRPAEGDFWEHFVLVNQANESVEVTLDFTSEWVSPLIGYEARFRGIIRYPLQVSSLPYSVPASIYEGIAWRTYHMPLDGEILQPGGMHTHGPSPSEFWVMAVEA